MKGIYIHIPFCESKCYYCDFNSFTNQEKYIKKYVSYLKKEINIYGKKSELDSINTVFIGGGTPSILESKYIIEILKEIYKYREKESIKEITIEINPGTINEEKIINYHHIGINRVSIGVQSLKDETLKSIGRLHSSVTAIETIKMVKKYIENISVDLIFGLPKQTISDFISDLKTMIKLKVKHLSLYSLKIEEGTFFYDLEKEGKLKLPEEETERKMYRIGREILKENGYFQYEISNFSKKGFESKHNLLYWNQDSYIGVGLSSASFLNKRRYTNHYNFNSYFKDLDNDKLPINRDSLEILDLKDEISEYCILRLRLNQGILKESFYKKFGIELNSKYKYIIQKNIEKGLLIEDKEKVYLTEKGFDIANQVYIDFL